MVGGQSCVLYTVLSYLYQHVVCQIHMVQNDNQWWLMKKYWWSYSNFFRLHPVFCSRFHSSSRCINKTGKSQYKTGTFGDISLSFRYSWRGPRLEGKYYWIKITLKEKNKFENPTLCVCIVNAWDLTLPVLLCLFEQYLDNVKATVHEHLRNLINSPSVQMQDIPPDLLSLENTEEHDPDIRNHQDQTDKRSVRIELHVFCNEISGFST